MQNKSKKKVLFISHCSHLGGAEIVLLRFLEKIRLFESVVFLPEGELSRELRSIDIPVVKSSSLGRLNKSINRFWPIGFIIRWLRSQFELFHVIKSTQADIVQCNNFPTVIYCLLPARLTGKPLVWHMHDFVGKYWWQRALVFLYRPFVAHTVSVSDSVKKSLVNMGCAENKISTVYNSVSEDQIVSNNKELREKIRGFKKGHDLIVGVSGSIEERKGFLDVLQALETINKRADKKTGLIIAGKTNDIQQEDYHKSLIQYINEHSLEKNVLFLGHIKETGAFFSEIDLFIHYPKDPDPLPTVIIEALLLKCPVLVSDNGGNSEIVRNGQWGALVPANQPKALAEAIGNWKGISISDAEQEKIQAFFSHKKKESDHVSLYGLITGNKSVIDQCC